ncbi:MAG: hypothetical protein GY774_41555 [Planctomycetes bacterium]|nr:hypothetical protein [Planctomycetota bacterium]
MNVNLDMKSNYKEFANRSHEKTKPIQTQFKPKQSQFWANIKAGKAKTNPIKANNQSSIINNIVILACR